MLGVVVDFETFSPRNNVGLDRYMKNVQPLIMAWKTLDSEQVFSSDTLTFGPLRFWADCRNVLSRFLSWGYTILAHNYAFEKQLIDLILEQDTPIDRFICTQALCGVNGLPLGLENACQYLGIQGKDKEGDRLIKLFSNPRTPTRKDPRTRVMPHDQPEQFQLFIEYCKQDVRAQHELFEKLS